MRIVPATVLIVLLVLPAAFPATALAKPNTGAFNKSSEGFKKQLASDFCMIYHDELKDAEAAADKNAGTPKAAKYAKQADQAWQKGVQYGCSWAA
jgi:hypothetical protein